MEASVCTQGTSRLHVTDRSTKIEFLIDTGSDLCVFPRSRIRGRLIKSGYELFAAHGPTIATYGWRTLNLEFGLRRAFTWRFVIADVKKLITGVDFLSHYNLLVDTRNGRLLDGITGLHTPGTTAKAYIGQRKNRFRGPYFSILPNTASFSGYHQTTRNCN